MRRLRPKETENAPPTSTQRKSWCHRRAGGENRGRGQGGLTRPRAGREDCGRGRGRHTWAGAPTPNLAPGWGCRGHGDAKARKRPTLSPACPLTPAQQQTASELPGTANGYWSTATPRTTSSHLPSHEAMAGRRTGSWSGSTASRRGRPTMPSSNETSALTPIFLPVRL